MNYTNYYQFYNEFLYQQHKSLLNRSQKCEIEENEENIQQNGQVKIYENIDVTTRLALKSNEKEEKSSIISTRIKRKYSSSSESEIGEMNSRQKSIRNLRRKRRRSLMKIQSTEEYETSSTSSACSETESILIVPKSSKQIKLSSFDVADNKLVDKEIQRDAYPKNAVKSTQQENERMLPKKVSDENSFIKSKGLKIKTKELPEDLKWIDRNGLHLRKYENSKFITAASSEKNLFSDKNYSNVPWTHNFQMLPIQPYEQAQLNGQYFAYPIQSQISQFNHSNYIKFYEAQPNFSFHSHNFEGQNNFAVENETLGNQNGLNINQMYHNFNESHKNFSEFYANHTKPVSNATKINQDDSTQAHHLFPIPNLYCNKPLIQPLSIPIQSPLTPNIFKCDNCPKIFKSIVRLKNHIEKHHSRKLAYKCKYCRSSFKRKSKLLNHQHKFHSEEFSSRKKSSVFHNVELLAQSDCHRN